MAITFSGVPGLMSSGHDLEFEESQTLAVTWAIREIIRHIESRELAYDAQTGTWVRIPQRIIPQTVLAVDAEIGDTSVTVDPASGYGVTAFEKSGLLTTYDLTDEEHLKVDDGWDEQSPVVPLSFKGLEYAGLRFPHPAGTPVGSGLYTESPETLDHMLDYANPVLFMTMLGHRRYADQFGTITPVYMVRLEYRLAETQPRSIGLDNELMDPNQWGFRIQRRVNRTIELIGDALEQSWSLRTPLGEVAVGQSDPRNPGGEVWTEELNSVLVKQNTLQYSAAATLPVFAQLKYLNQ